MATKPKETRNKTLTVTLTGGERARVHAAAKADGRTASTWAYRVLMAELDKSKKGKAGG